MKLITEITEDVEYLTETQNGVKKFYIEGPYLTVNEANRNGRIYENSVMAPAVDKYLKEFISAKRSVGELGHPDSPSINLDRVSHMIESLKYDGGKHYIGRAKILESTPMGKIAAALIEEGVRIGVSSRGLGSLVERNGVKYVQNDFFINAIDIVSDPSGPGCMVRGIFENKEWDFDNHGNILEVYVDYKKKKIDEEKALRAFSGLLESFRRNR